MSERPYLTFEEGLRITGVLCDLYACHECPIFDTLYECPMENFASLTADERYELRDKLYNWAKKHHMSYRKRYFQEYDDYLNERRMCVLDYYPAFKRPKYCDHKEHPELCSNCWREKCFVKTISPLKSNDTAKL